MIKTMILGRRAPGRSRRQAQWHLKNIHGRMVLQPPPNPGPMPKNYVQNHIIDGLYPGTGPHGLERDLFTQIWFDDIAHLQASTKTPYYLENMQLDEPRFVDESNVVFMLVRSDMDMEDREEGYKAFIVLGLSGDGSVDVDTVSEQAAAWFGRAPGLAAQVCNHILPPPGDAPRFADLVLEGWFTECEDARAAAEGLNALLEALPSGAVDPNRCLAVLAETFTSDRLLRYYDSTPAPDQG